MTNRGDNSNGASGESGDTSAKLQQGTQGSGSCDKNLSDLIARLEAATEGSRELDGDVHVAVQSADEEWVHDGNGRCAKYMRPMHKHLESAPHYTTSLDAALTLVPKGYGAVAGGVGDQVIVGTNGPAWFAVVDVATNIGHWSERRAHGEAVAGTAAIALCIAALKARAA